MLKIALSGNIGCGKSTFGAYLASYGAYVVEVDELMRRLLHFDIALSAKLKAAFGESLFENQAFSEQKSKAYFSENIKLLEQFHKIVNPYIEKAAAEKLRHAKSIKAPYFVLVSPDISMRNYLGTRIFDYSVKVNCSLENQFKRLKSRSSQDDLLILDLMSRNSKIKHSQVDTNYNISNDFDLNYLKLNAKSFHNKFLKTPPNYFKIQLKNILAGGVFCTSLAGAQSIYPSCILAGTCVITTNQTSTVSSTTDNQNFILNSGVSVSTTLNNPAFNLLNNGTSLINNGTITTTGNGSLGSYAAINSPGLTFTTLGSIINNGVIANTRTGGTSAPAINLWGTTGTGAGSGSLDSLVNNSAGEISTSSGNAILLHANGLITTLTNFGSISTGGDVATYFGISNTGSITTLNNAQGAGNAAGPLTYKGILPANYNIIINSPTIFGRLAVTSPSGLFMSFGIYTGSTIRNGTYSSVITGVPTSYFPATSGRSSGSYGSVSWALSNNSGGSYIWDLTLSDYVEPVTGPSIANTNQSLVNTASALQGTYTLQNSVLANSFSYDCTVFGANDVCVSAGGRNTQVQAANGLNNTSALLIAAYRPHPNYRIGAYADQNLSVSNPGGTVNLGNNTPLIGLFAAWNERLDGTGAEVKVSAAYGQKNTTINRSVVGSGDGASEAGTGSSKLISQGAQATAKYGFGILDNVIVSPYVGVRYTQNNMGGYTEGTSSSVTAPLTYSALNTNATTALAGVGASYRVIPQVMTFASAGVETDTNTANGTYSATNTSIGTLTPVNFNANPVRTRPTVTVGTYYDIEKNQRLGITGIYRQEAYQAVSTTTVMATYTVGL